MPTCAFSQSTGQLRFLFQPPYGVSYVLDGKYRMAEQELTLTEGPHRFTFWAPERRMLDTTLHVAPDRLTEVAVTLRYAPAFIDHRHALDRHQRLMRWSRWGPPVLTAGTGAWATVAWIRHVRADQRLDELAESYRSSADPRGIERLKNEEIPVAKDDFRRSRTGAYVATGAFVLSAGATVLLRHTVLRRPPPAYRDEERVRFEGLVCAPPAPGAWPAAVPGPWRFGATFVLR